MKNIKILIAFMVVAVFGLTAVSSASAECGPGFTSKQQLIQVVKENPSIAHGMRKELLAHKAYSGYQADETVLNWLRSPEQKVFAAPSGYTLNSNTYCPGGYGKYQPYGGLLGNMPGKVMLWHCDKEGHNCVPILKGYCMNFVMGPSIKKQKPQKCRCKKKHHHKHKHHKKPTCQAIGKKTGPAGSCVNQTVTVTPTQECEANNHSGTNCQQVTVTIVANCSNVAVGNEGYVGQGGNCQTGGEQTCVGQGNCVVEEEKPCNCTPPPCECKPPAEPESPKVSLERVQEVLRGHSRPICATVTPTSSVSNVQFEFEYGERSNGGKGVYNASANKFCVTYTAPTGKVPHTCVEPIAPELPQGTECDIVEVTVTCSNGAKSVTVRGEIPIIDEPSWE